MSADPGPDRNRRFFTAMRCNIHAVGPHVLYLRVNAKITEDQAVALAKAAMN